eukprot:gene1532-12658_t
MRKKQFKVDQTKIKFNKVPLTNQRRFQKLMIENLNDQTIEISLESSLKEISFQNSNVNEQFQTPIFYNEIFNLIDKINSVKIEKKAKKEIFLVFEPKYIEKEQDAKLYSYKHLEGFIKLSSKTQHEELEIEVSTCKSFIETDTNELEFGDSVVGKKINRDFSIWNRSEIPAQFSIDIQKNKHYSIELTNYETNSVIEKNTQIPGYSHIRISVSLMIETVGDFETSIFIKNELDDKNVHEVFLRSIVMDVSQFHGLMIQDESGGVIKNLNFGDCYTHSFHVKKIFLKNISDEKFDVHLTSTSPDEVYFEIISELVENEQQEKSESRFIEEISFSPGAVIQIGVCYTPIPEKTDETLLKKKDIRILMKCVDYKGKEKFSRKLLVTSRICTSIVELIEDEINFGDSDIGTVKTKKLQLVNKSQLPATIRCEMKSHVLTCSLQNQETTINPNQIIDILINISPRKINPVYKKSITLINLNNPKNLNIITIRSNNIDPNMLTFHSQFYEVLTKSQHNYAKSIDFQNVIINQTCLNSFILKNVSKDKIELNLNSSSPKEIQFYIQKNREIKNEKVIGLLEKRFSKLKQKEMIQQMLSQEETKTIQKEISPSSQENQSLQSSILSHLKSSFDDPLKFDANFQDTELEKLIVKFMRNRKKTLNLLIDEKILISTNKVVLKPLEEIIVYVTFTPKKEFRNNVIESFRAFNEILYIDLKLEEMIEEIPVRELNLMAKICQLVMNVSQKNINFGEILNTEEKRKTIPITNYSEYPLMYKVVKTGSISSGDLQFDSGNYGIIRPYGNRELIFNFKPSFSGKFMETINILNVLNAQDDTLIKVKAIVKQPERFTIKESEINFGSVILNSYSTMKKIVIQNTSKNKITLMFEEFENEFNYQFDYQYEFEELSEDNVEVEKLEAEYEKCEHKLRIYIRKGKKEKAVELQKRIDDLKKILGITEEETRSASDYDEDDEKKKKYRKTKNGIYFSIPSLKIQTILISIKPIGESKPIVESGNISFNLYEKKNKDVKKVIKLKLEVQYNENFNNQNLSKKSPKKLLNQNEVSNSTNSKDFLSISPKNIDFGNIKIGEVQNGKFNLKNNSEKNITFVVLNPKMDTKSKLSFSKKNGDLKENDSIDIHFTYTPNAIGVQRFSILVQELPSKFEHEIIVTSKQDINSPIEFPDLKNDIFDFGYCYLDSTKEYSKVIPIHMKNVSNENYNVDISTNIKKQISIFRDKNLSAECKEQLKFEPNSTNLIYIGLKPFLNKYDLEKGNCRLLQGGLMFKVIENVENKSQIVNERKIKFKCLTGSSILSTSSNLIDLGRTDKISVYEGSFKLQNLNKNLPLKYKLKVSNDQLKLESYEGYLNGSKMNKPYLDEIKFSFQTESFGLNVAKIIVENEMTNDIQEIIVRMFVDDDSIKTNLPRNSERNVEELLFKNLYIPRISSSEDLKNLNFPEFSETFILKNTSKKLLSLIPVTDFNLKIETKNQKSIEEIDFKKDSNLYYHEFFDIESESTVQVVVFIDGSKLIEKLDKESLKTLKTGKKVEINGNLQFISVNTETNEINVVKSIDLHIFACISEGLLVFNEIEIGKIGYINHWEYVGFTMMIKNLSETNLILEQNEEDEFVVLENSSLTILPFETNSFTGVLLSSKFQHQIGEFEHIVKLRNLFNPENELLFKLTGEVTSCIWKYRRLENEDCFALPTIKIPSLDQKFTDNFFTIQNESNDSIDVSFSIQSSPEIKHFLKLELMDHLTTLPLKSHKFLPKTMFDVRVKCYSIPGTKIPKHLIHKVLTKENPNENDNQIYFGDIIMRSKEQPVENIKVFGTIQQNSTFSLSTNRLILHNEMDHFDQYMDVLTIKNLSSNSHLNFKVIPIIPKSSNIRQIRIIPEEAVMSKLNHLTISIFVKTNTPDENSPTKLDDKNDEFYIEVIDLFHPLSKQKIPVQFVTISNTPTEESGKFDNMHPLKSPRRMSHHQQLNVLGGITGLEGEQIGSKLQLKGCNMISVGDSFENYEIDLGQQNYLSEELEWDISLENTTKNSISYKIYLTGYEDEEKSWLKLSRVEGILKEKFETQIITLKFLKKELNNFMTYIVIENLNNPKDLKFIRIHMETVVAHLIDSLNAFKIYIDEEPIESKSIMDLGNVFLNEMIHHHTIDIFNQMDIPLEFHLSSNHDEEFSELHFSLSLTSLKSFDNLLIDANKSIRIYIMYKPTKILKEKCSEEIEISIKCRILKDYKERFKLKAKINEPSMKVFQQELLFISEGENENFENLKPKVGKIKIKNLKEKKMKFFIKTSSLYFDIDQIAYQLKRETEITIKPNIKKILENQNFLKLQYIEEHLFIYNVENLNEKYVIDLKLTRGSVRQFYTAPGTKTGYAFSHLEKQIIIFLTNFSSHKIKENLFFDFIYLIDELIYYCLKGRVSEPFFDLAKLLFEMLFHNKLFNSNSNSQGSSPLIAKGSPYDLNSDPNLSPLSTSSSNSSIDQNFSLELKKWIDQLNRFLSYFPAKKKEKCFKFLLEKFFVNEKNSISNEEKIN